MMYAVFSIRSGELLRTVDCPEDVIDSQVHDGEQVLLICDGEFSWNSFLENGVLVNLPPKPSSYHIFDYETKRWIDPRTPETEWPLIRSKRGQLLLACDWTQLPDVPIATKVAWADYRQALRDITDQTDPFNIVWPVAP